MSQLKINGREVPFEEGQTILEAAQAAGINIPTLCHLPQTQAHGVCRVCVVEVAGADRLLPSCETPAAEGMEVKTDSPRVREARKGIIEMLIASGQHNCLVMDLPPEKWTSFQIETMSQPWHDQICPAHGDCRLQDLAVEYGVTMAAQEPPSGDYPLDDEHPMIVRDFSRCIQCGRCVAACNEVQVNRAIPAPGARARIRTRPRAGTPWWTTTTAPTAASACRPARWGPCSRKRPMAWPTANEVEKVRTTCPYCGVGCQQWLHVKDNKIVQV